MEPSRRARLVALFLASTVLAAGCATVPPWDRGDLAKPQVAFDPDPALSGYRNHVFSSREAGAAGVVGAGGGCGCY